MILSRPITSLRQGHIRFSRTVEGWCVIFGTSGIWKCIIIRVNEWPWWLSMGSNAKANGWRCFKDIQPRILWNFQCKNKICEVKIDVISCVYILLPIQIKRILQDARIPKKMYFLLALSIDILIVGGVEESKHHVTLSSLHIMDPLDVYSEANTTTQSASFSSK